jgi:hypothetical protein
MSNLTVMKKMYDDLIRRKIPKVQKIVIDVNMSKDKEYVSKIKVICKGRVLWAMKKGSSINKSLRQATQAITEQIQTQEPRAERRFFLRRNA